MAPQPFFIVGTQRSGTTLLCQMLNAHPRLYALNEFWDLYEYLSGKDTNQKEMRRILVQHLALPPDDPLFPESAPGDPFEPFRDTELAFDRKLRLLGKTRWGIKDPRLTYFLPLFAEHYPQARFVVIIRDPRAVVSSQIKERWNIANVYAGAILYREELKIQKDFQATYPERVHWVRYRDLVERPREELETICEFLGEDFDEKVLNYHQQAPDFYVHGGNQNISRNVDPSFVDGWRKRISVMQASLIESIVGPLMEEYGFERIGKQVKIGPVQRTLFHSHQWLLTTYRWQQRTGWSGIRNHLRRLVALPPVRARPAKKGGGPKGSPN